MTQSIRQESNVTPLYLVNDPPAEYSTGFIRIPNDWFDWASGNLSHTEYRMATTIMRWQRGNTHPSITTLAKQSGMSKRWAIRTLHALKQKGVIEIEKRKRGLTNGYKIIWLQESSEHSDIPAQTSRHTEFTTQETPLYGQTVHNSAGVNQSSPPPMNYSSPLNRQRNRQQEEDEEKKLHKRVSLTEESSCERRAREEKKETAEPPLSSPPSFGSVPPRDSKQPGENSRGKDNLPPGPPLSPPPQNGDSPWTMVPLPMSKAHIKTIMMIFEGKIDPRAPDDPDFMAVLDSIDDDEWSEELRVLDPWRKGGVSDE